MDKHGCTIIIDTNQFHGDFMLSETRWKNLLQYLKKTNASLQMPTIIWEEIARNYRKNLESHLSQAKATFEKINHHLNFNAELFGYNGWANRLKLDGLCLTPLELTYRYMSFLKSSLHLELKDFLDWDKKWMPDIVSRAIEHTKPFAEDSDKGFKDTLIWMTIMSLADRPGFKQSPIVFISANNRDFGDRTCPGKIHPTLYKEANLRGLTVHYFDHLDTFFEKWAAEALNVNFDKIRSDLPEPLIKANLKEYVRPYIPRNESPEQNTFITGMSFKVVSEADRGRTIKMSISGYITNSLAPTKYLDFSSEATLEEEGVGKKLTVESFDVLDPSGYLYNSLPDVLIAYKSDFCS